VPQAFRSGLGSRGFDSGAQRRVESLPACHLRNARSSAVGVGCTTPRTDVTDLCGPPDGRRWRRF